MARGDELRENFLNFRQRLVGVQMLAIDVVTTATTEQGAETLRSLSSASTTMYSPRPRRAVAPM